MTWHVTEDVEQFLAAAGDLMLAEPGVHTIVLSACENARAGVPGIRFAWWQEPSLEVTGAVSHLSPYPLFLAAVPDEAVAPLVEQLAPTRVAGRTDLAVQVAAAAARSCGRTATVRFAERLFRLGTLTVPDVPGTPRLAEEQDRSLLLGWHHEFVAETGVIAGDGQASVADRLSYGGFVLWEDEGTPVALAGHSRVAFGAGRIGPVWTPPEHRGRGYGGAVTAAAARRLVERGAWEVVLFTDLNNPTSNALYRRLGFAPVHDVAVLEIA